MSTSWGKQKPPLGAQINWAHPLARGLEAAMFTPGSLTNLRLPYVAGAISSSPDGMAHSFPGSSQATYSDASELLAIGNGSSDGPFSILAGFRHANTTTFAGIVGKATGATTGEWYLTNNGGVDPDALIFRVVDQSAPRAIGKTTTTRLRSGQPAIVVATYDGSAAASGIKIYLAGADITTSDANTGAGTYVASERVSTTLYMGSRGGANYMPSGSFVSSFAAWKRVLTPAEVQWLNSEPYAFIQPPQPWRKYFVPEISAPTAGQPLIMRTATIPHLGGSLRQARF